MNLSHLPHVQGFAGELDVDAELERMEGGGRGGGGRQQQRRLGDRFTPTDKSKKREQRDGKYGVWGCGGGVCVWVGQKWGHK